MIININEKSDFLDDSIVQEIANGNSLTNNEVIDILREKGFRVTNQRRILIDIILRNEFSNCKEIYYEATKLDHTIGSATVYRMVNTLEKIGVISRNSMYKILEK